MKPASISLFLLAVGAIAQAQSPGTSVTVRVPKPTVASRPDVLIPPVMPNAEREIVLPGPNGDRLGVIQPSAQYCLQEDAGMLSLQDTTHVNVTLPLQYTVPQILTTPPKGTSPESVTITPQYTPYPKISVQQDTGQPLQYFVPNYTTQQFLRTDVTLLGTAADKRVKFSSRGTPIKQALDMLLKGTGIGYRLDGAAAQSNAKVRISLENVRLASALDVITESVNLYWSVVKVANGPGVQSPLVVISDHPSQTVYQLLDGFDTNQWGDYDMNGNRYWAVTPYLNYDLRKFNDSVPSYDYEPLRTPNVVPLKRTKDPDPVPIKLIDPRILNIPTLYLQDGGQNQNVAPLLLNGTNSMTVPYINLQSNPEISWSLPKLGQSGKIAPLSLYTLSSQEVHSTFTCPHCGKKTTVVRAAGKRGSQAPWKFCPFCGKPVK